MELDDVLQDEDLVSVLPDAHWHSHPAELWHHRSLFPRFLLKWSFECSAAIKRAFRPPWCDTWKLKDSQTGCLEGLNDPNQFNQIKIMPFIQTSFTQRQSANPKATTLCVYNMSLFLVDCLINRWQLEEQVVQGTKKTMTETWPRHEPWNLPFPTVSMSLNQCSQS